MRRITWLGHATVLIETASGARIVTDPLLRGRVAHLQRHVPPAAALDAVDAVLISHVHMDHLDRPSLRRLARPGTRIVVPEGAAGPVHGLPFGTVSQLRAGDRVRAGADVEIEAVPAWHPSSRWGPVGPKLEALGFLLDGIWFAGDTELDDEMERLRGRVDVALLPAWGWGPSLGPGHLDPQQAAQAVALVQPRIAIPMHWGTYLPYGLHRRHGHLLRTPGPQFAEHVKRLAPETKVELLRPGQSVEL
ncbi:MAG TPA: MBL fold metallo-hydrolase [Conexibacter sp.]|jgi:L-ascorbate metabolism protein UlaG (beta-lactamase superfamily)